MHIDGVVLLDGINRNEDANLVNSPTFIMPLQPIDAAQPVDTGPSSCNSRLRVDLARAAENKRLAIDIGWSASPVLAACVH